MICGGNRQSETLKQTDKGHEDIVLLSKSTSFKLQELKDMYTRYRDITRDSGKMDSVKFREMIGFVHNKSSKNIVDRIFESIAEADGISFVRFIEYMDKLKSGSQQVKVELCFNIIDSKRKGYFTYEDIELLVASIINNDHLDSSQTTSKTLQLSRYLFNSFDSSSTGRVGLESFSRAVDKDKSLLEIFTLLNNGIYEHFVTSKVEEERRLWFADHTKYATISLKNILNALDNKGGEVSDNMIIYNEYEKKKQHSQDKLYIKSNMQKIEIITDSVIHPGHNFHKEKPTVLPAPFQPRIEDIDEGQRGNRVMWAGKVKNMSSLKRENLKEARSLEEEEAEINDSVRGIGDVEVRLVSDAAMKPKGREEAMALRNRKSTHKPYDHYFMFRNKMVDLIKFTEDVYEKVIHQVKKSEFKDKRTSISRNISQPKGSMISPLNKDWNLVINMMIGTNKALRAVWDMDEHIITKNDYKIKDVYQLSYYRSIEEQEQLKGTCYFHHYAPYIFADIRKMFGVDDESFLNSIGSESLLTSLIKGELKTFSQLTSSGKSGSFFFYSVDGKYVLKTIKREEFQFLRKILKSYHEFLGANRSSLIPKYFSLNKISFDGFKLRNKVGYDRVYFVVMNNIFNKDKQIHERFDLKGSTHNREVFPPETTTKNLSNLIKTSMKDLDFIKRKKYIEVTGAQRKHLLEIIRNDCEFFERLKIIDYSLLIGIHYKDKDKDKEENKERDDQIGKGDFSFSEESLLSDLEADSKEIPTSSSFVSPNNKDQYFIGLIDILTPFSTVKKKCEYAIKRMCVGNTISCIPPKDYSKRFLSFIDSITRSSS